MSRRDGTGQGAATGGMGRRAFLRWAMLGAATLAGPGLGVRGVFSATAGGCSDGDPASFTAARTGTFVLFSDVHFDPFADPSLLKALVAAPASGWRDILSGAPRGYSPYGRDSNDALFQSFLDDMARRVPRPDALFYPGDMLCHDFWTLYPRLTGDATAQGLRAFIAKTAEYFLTEVTRRFPGVPLYLALGNNDSVEGDYKIAPESPYLAITAPLVARLALQGDSARAAFLDGYPHDGCYALPLPGPTAGRLVVFNNIFWTKRSPHQDAGRPVMDFLERELATAASRGEKVWLMAHVPPGDNSKSSAAKFLKKGKEVSAPLLAGNWGNELAALLVRHAGTVRACLTGHVHRDEFRLVCPAPDRMPVAAMRLGPSISPITGNNPGYQIYTYDAETLDLLDMTTPYLDLGASGPAWADEYTYSRTYGRGLRSPRDWREMYRQLQDCPARRAAFAAGFDLKSGHIDEVTERTFPIFWEALSLSPGVAAL